MICFHHLIGYLLLYGNLLIVRTIFCAQLVDRKLLAILSLLAKFTKINVATFNILGLRYVLCH